MLNCFYVPFVQSGINDLNNKIIKCYYYFNSFKSLFQSRSVSIHKLHERLLKDICQDFVKPHLIHKNVCFILFAEKRNLLAIDDIFTGSECQKELKILLTTEKIMILELKKNCSHFYCKAVDEMVSYF